MDEISRSGSHEHAAPACETSMMLRRDSPQIILSSNSQFPKTLDKLKIRKRVQFFPIRVTFKADYETKARTFTYGCSVKDTLLKGRFSLNVPDRRIGYRKQIALPNGSKVALVGSCTYMNGHVKPNFGIQFKFGANVPRVAGHTDAVWHGNSFGIRQKINVVSGLGLEVCGAMSFPEPTARYTYDGGSLVVGEGAFQLHVEEVNGVLKLGYD